MIQYLLAHFSSASDLNVAMEREVGGLMQAQLRC
jgi:hypothetical protein